MALIEAHDTRLMKTGGGILYAAPWVGETPPEEADFVDRGNSPGISFSLQITKLKHNSMRTGTKTVDKTKVTERGYTLKFKLDELSQTNLALLVGGTVDGNTIHAMTDVEAQWALRFIENNGSGAENITWNWWKCTIAPDGDTNLISLDNFKEMSFTAEGLDDSANHPESATDSPFWDMDFVEPTV